MTKTGPRPEPWGTPYTRGLAADIVPPSDLPWLDSALFGSRHLHTTCAGISSASRGFPTC